MRNANFDYSDDKFSVRMVSRQSQARMNNSQIRGNNPISFQLAYSHLEILANQLWRTALPDKVDFVYGRIWLHTLELAHRWKQTTAEDVLAGIDFTFDDSHDQNRFSESGIGNHSSEDDGVWCYPRWRPKHVSVLDEREKRSYGEVRADKFAESRDGGVEKERLKNVVKSVGNHGMPASDHQTHNLFECEADHTALPGLTKHCQEHKTGCSLIRPGVGGALEMAKYNTDSLLKNESVYFDKQNGSSAGSNESDCSALRNCFCYSNPFDPRLDFKGIFPASAKFPESKSSTLESQNGKTLAAAAVSMTNQRTENLFLSICNISAAFEQYVSGYRLFRLSLIRTPSISVPDDSQLSPQFRFSEPGCLTQADVVSLIRIPVDLSGADDGLIQLVQSIQSDQVRLLWLPPSSSSASPPLSYLPPPNEKNRSNPGPIRRPFAVPWRLRHKNAYATGRSISRHSVTNGSQDVLESNKPCCSCDSQDVKKVRNQGTNVAPSSFIQMPKNSLWSAQPGSTSKHTVYPTTRRPATTGTAAHLSRTNCMLKRKTSYCTRQDVGSKKDRSRLSTWSRALSTKGRLWDDNDLLVTESSKDFDDLNARHRLLARRSLSDPDLCSLTSVDEKCNGRVLTNAKCCLSGQQGQHHGDLNVSGRDQHLFSSYPMTWVTGQTGKPVDEVAIHSRSTKTFLQNSDVMPCHFEKLNVSSGLERTASYPIAHPLYEKMAKFGSQPAVNSCAKETARDDSSSRSSRSGHGAGAGGLPLVRLVAPRKLSAGHCIVLPTSPHVGSSVASSNSFQHCADVVVWQNSGLVVLQRTAPPVGLKTSSAEEMDEGVENRCGQRRVIGSGMTPLIRLNAVLAEPYNKGVATSAPPPPPPTHSSAQPTTGHGQNMRLIAHQGVHLGHVLVNQPRVVVPCPALSVQRLHSGDIVDAGEPDRICVVRDLPSPSPSFHHSGYPQCVVPQVLSIAHSQPMRTGMTKNSPIDSCGAGGWLSGQPPSHSTYSTMCHPCPKTTGGICFTPHQADPFSGLNPQRLSYSTAALKRSVNDDFATTANNRFSGVALPLSDNRFLVQQMAFHSPPLERSAGVEFPRQPGAALITDIKPCANLNAEALPFISHKFLGPSNSPAFSLGVVCPQWPHSHEPGQGLQLDSK